MLGIVLEPTLVGLKNLIYKGSIECEEDLYKVNLGYKYTDWTKQYKIGKSNYHRMPGYEIGYSKNIVGLMETGCEMLSNAFRPDKKLSSKYEHFINYSDDELLTSIFPKGIPVCNKENAKKVEVALKEKVKKAEAQLKRAMNELAAQKKLPAPAIKSKTNT
ncbi:MAG: hypothetical protein H7235_05880 [Bdellovibrionaceae bacterium]|nr:hypothetical protein [Pseudobdellovibrionaceae bacterium]